MGMGGVGRERGVGGMVEVGMEDVVELEGEWKGEGCGWEVESV